MKRQQVRMTMKEISETKEGVFPGTRTVMLQLGHELRECDIARVGEESSLVMGDGLAGQGNG